MKGSSSTESGNDIFFIAKEYSTGISKRSGGLSGTGTTPTGIAPHGNDDHLKAALLLFIGRLMHRSEAMYSAILGNARTRFK